MSQYFLFSGILQMNVISDASIAIFSQVKAVRN